MNYSYTHRYRTRLFTNQEDAARKKKKKEKKERNYYYYYIDFLFVRRNKL